MKNIYRNVTKHGYQNNDITIDYVDARNEAITFEDIAENFELTKSQIRKFREICWEANQKVCNFNSKDRLICCTVTQYGSSVNGRLYFSIGVRQRICKEGDQFNIRTFKFSISRRGGFTFCDADGKGIEGKRGIEATLDTYQFSSLHENCTEAQLLEVNGQREQAIADRRELHAEALQVNALVDGPAVDLDLNTELGCAALTAQVASWTEWTDVTDHSKGEYPVNERIYTLHDGSKLAVRQQWGTRWSKLAVRQQWGTRWIVQPTDEEQHAASELVEVGTEKFVAPEDLLEMDIVIKSTDEVPAVVRDEHGNCWQYTGRFVGRDLLIKAVTPMGPNEQKARKDIKTFVVTWWSTKEETTTESIDAPDMLVALQKLNVALSRVLSCEVALTPLG